MDRFRWILWRVVGGGFAAHAGFAVVFLALGKREAGIATAAGLIMPALAYALMRRERTEAAFSVASVDIAVSSVLGTILAGEGSGFLFYVMVPLVLAALHPTRSSLARWSWVAFLAITYVALEVAWPPHSGLTAWPSGTIHFLHVLNVLIVSASMVVVALLSALTIARAERRLEEALQRMEGLALRDGLTDLLNRRAMRNVLSREAARARRYGRSFSVLMADVDLFKSVNDRYGHAVGDDVLRTVARTLRSTLRHQDLVARWGGEEFLALLPETDVAAAAQVAEKLRRTVEEAVTTCQGQAVRVTMTFGVAGSQDDSSIDTVIGVADQAMYDGKRAGRNRVIAYGSPPAK